MVNKLAHVLNIVDVFASLFTVQVERSKFVISLVPKKVEVKLSVIDVSIYSKPKISVAEMKAANHCNVDLGFIFGMSDDPCTTMFVAYFLKLLADQGTSALAVADKAEGASFDACSVSKADK